MVLWLLACTGGGTPGTGEPAAPVETGTTGSADTGPALVGDVEGVTVSGDPGRYDFAVTLASPDLDCSRYADWWEVVSGEGELLYRRILNHSHADEQPFTRSGGPVATEADPCSERGPAGRGRRAPRASPGLAASQQDLERVSERRLGMGNLASEPKQLRGRGGGCAEPVPQGLVGQVVDAEVHFDAGARSAGGGLV